MSASRFQSFEDASHSQHSAERLAALRRQMKAVGLDGFIVPRADEHQDEYTPACAERLAWLTGFTGSAGIAIILMDRAALFVDGRYTIQAGEQVDSEAVTPIALADKSPECWLRENLKRGGRLGYDAWLHTHGQVQRFERAATDAGAELIAASANPIDAIWTDRPPAPAEPVHMRPENLAGETAAAKLARVAAELGAKDRLFVSDPHALAWLFNLRGGDVSHTPIALGWGTVLRAGRPEIYLDPRKLTAEAREKLEILAELREPAQLLAEIRRAGQGGESVLFDAATAPVALIHALEQAGGKSFVEADPIALMKARKNAAELKGARTAHVRDGAALTRFLAWFAETAPAGRLTEISAAETLETFREQTGKLRDLSFPTISAAGPHAALPHYRVTRASNRKIGRGLFLLDSGAQYEDGTTDVTRTIAVGEPTADMRDRFTRVLKGHIAIARAVFPAGVSGAQIDAFARRGLWEAGLDFDHGAGHGVGAYLSVHEGPQRISKLGGTALEPGMILSNEPGYYKPGRWGIRIENLIVVEPRRIKGAEREMLGFETLTLAPIDLSLIEASLLDEQEIAWLDAYHARVRSSLAPALEPKIAKWLTQATRPLRAPRPRAAAAPLTPQRRGRATRPR